MLKVLRDGIEGLDRIRTLLQIDRDIMNILADVDPGTIPVFLLRLHGMKFPPLTATVHPGQGGTTAKFQSLERGRGRTAPSVTDADHGSGQATVRVTEHAIALWTTTAPTRRQITASSKPPRQAPFYVPDRADAARGGVTRDIRKASLRLGHGELTTTGTYLHASQAEKLKILETSTQPSIRLRNFHGVRDSLMDLLGGK